MRIHTDTLSGMAIIQLFQAEKHAGRIAHSVTLDISRKGSRTHRSAFEVRLESSEKEPGDGRRFGNTGSYGATSPRNGYPDVWAATYDEWGWFLAALYARDPKMVCGSQKHPVYSSRENFDARTAWTYNPERLLPELDRGADPYPWLAKGSAKSGRHGAGRYADDWPHASLPHFANHAVRTAEWYREFAKITPRLEYLRGELRAERISYGELAELQGMAALIPAHDVELLEAAGVAEVHA